MRLLRIADAATPAAKALAIAKLREPTGGTIQYKDIELTEAIEHSVGLFTGDITGIEYENGVFVHEEQIAAFRVELKQNAPTIKAKSSRQVFD